MFTRYPGVAATAGDNCVLSGQAVAELVSSSSLLVDDAWDLYQRIESGYNCRGAQTGQGIHYTLYIHKHEHYTKHSEGLKVS